VIFREIFIARFNQSGLPLLGSVTISALFFAASIAPLIACDEATLAHLNNFNKFRKTSKTKQEANARAG
jgi:hypothetical protein